MTLHISRQQSNSTAPRGQVQEMAKIAAANNLFGGQCTVPRVTQEFMGERLLRVLQQPSAARSS
jgi:hypothetical protein